MGLGQVLMEDWGFNPRAKGNIKNPSLLFPPMLFPLMNFLAFAGGLSRLRHVPGFDFHGGYTAFRRRAGRPHR